MPHSSPPRNPPWWAIALFLVTLAVFLPTLRHDFVTYDDPAYVVGEPHVNTGLTWANVRWAWTSFEHSNWHPLTWLSHQLDCTLFGLAPWGHHLTSVLLHAASTLLLFLVLRRATGFHWRSLIVAALFGLHPLRVESVAWIAERKDVLSTFLMMLTLWAYVAYARLCQSGARRAWLPYALAVVGFAVGLTAKPMLVTLPCVLLLFDLWPLDRWLAGTWRGRARLFGEKLPFFLLAAASCVLTYMAQNAGGAVKTVDNFEPSVRVANAIVAYAGYLGKLLWPADLGVLYPNFGEMPPTGQIVFGSIVLLALSAAVLLAVRRGHHWASVGWLWYLGTLVPVIGFVQVGGQTMADRYSYIPSIGVLIALVWAVAEFTRRLPHRPIVLGVAASAVVATSAAATGHQLGYWKNSVTLFEHTIAVTDDNWMAHFNLFLHYQKSPATAAEARREYTKTAMIVARFAELQNQRGLALLDQPGRLDDAIAYFRKSIRVKKDHAGAHVNLGRALLRRPDRRADALAEFQTALRYEPDNPEATLQLAKALAEDPATLSQAITALRMAVWQLDDRADVHLALADALARDPRRHREAISEYERTLQLDPQNVGARAGLAKLR